MRGQRRSLIELSTARWALVRFFPGVYSDMLPEMVPTVKALHAEGTRMSLRNREFRLALRRSGCCGGRRKPPVILPWSGKPHRNIILKKEEVFLSSMYTKYLMHNHYKTSLRL